MATSEGGDRAGLFFGGQAIKTLRRQQATLNLLWWRAHKRETPEQHARLVEKNMRGIYARQDEDSAAEAAAPPPPHVRQRMRALIDSWDAAVDESGDGDNAA